MTSQIREIDSARLLMGELPDDQLDLSRKNWLSDRGRSACAHPLRLRRVSVGRGSR